MLAAEWVSKRHQHAATQFELQRWRTWWCTLLPRPAAVTRPRFQIVRECRVFHERDLDCYSWNLWEGCNNRNPWIGSEINSLWIKLPCAWWRFRLSGSELPLAFRSAWSRCLDPPPGVWIGSRQGKRTSVPRPWNGIECVKPVGMRVRISVRVWF